MREALLVVDVFWRWVSVCSFANDNYGFWVHANTYVKDNGTTINVLTRTFKGILLDNSKAYISQLSAHIPRSSRFALAY